MKRQLFTVFFLVSCLSLLAQVNPVLNELVIKVTARVQSSPPAIELTWNHSTAMGNNYFVYRKLQGGTVWDNIASLPVTDSIYSDNTVVKGMLYEYRVVKSTASSVVSWGYVSSGIEVLPELVNRGVMLILDTVVTDSVTAEIDVLEADLVADGYVVRRILTDRSELVANVKSSIVNAYNDPAIDFTSALVIGHVPVPYSGNLGPDAHANHQGAWPTDLFYADIDGNWTDVSINNTSGASTRTHNVPGDGKYDQSLVPSTLELEIGRIDFYDMGTFTPSEVTLLRNYLDKNHRFRNKLFVPGRRALMDEGGFATSTAGEGFGQSGPRAMIPIVGRDSMKLGDYFTALTQGSYLWSYGQGPGSYTSCGGIGTTADFAQDSVQSVFTMLFGSYFGDYDSPNNLMRAALASGTILTCSWSSTRPIWYYHHMAMGTPIGYSAKKSVNLEDEYLFINFGAGFPTNQGVHNVLMGDPTLRNFYLSPPSNLSASDNGDGTVAISWDASPDAEVTGYNLYRSPVTSYNYQLVNASLITSTSYQDHSVPLTGHYNYFLRAVKPEETASGTYYNESLGIYDSTHVVSFVGITAQQSHNIRVFPNPVLDKINIHADIPVRELIVTDMQGRVVKNHVAPQVRSVDVSDLPDGIYLVILRTDQGLINRKIVKQ